MTFIPYISSGGGGNFVESTAAFTPPPIASNWVVQGGASPTTPTDVPGGVAFIQNPPGTNGVFAKSLVSPGGSHVITMFMKLQQLYGTPTDATGFGFAVLGTTNLAFAGIQQDGDGLGPYRVAQVRTNAGVFVSNLGFPWAAETNQKPLSDAWWRLTFDNSNLTVERAPVGGVYYTVWTGAHSVGAIQKVGFYIVSSNFVVSGQLLSYVET